MPARMPQAALFAAAVAALPLAAVAVPRAGDVAPPISLKILGSGKTQTLAAFKGKPVYLNFFASWCGPCNEEAPSIVKLYKKYHPQGLVALGVNELDPEAKAKSFVDQYKLPFTVLLYDSGSTGKDYGTLALPVHVFIARDGKISTYRLGEMSNQEIEDAIKEIVKK